MYLYINILYAYLRYWEMFLKQFIFPCYAFCIVLFYCISFYQQSKGGKIENNKGLYLGAQNGGSGAQILEKSKKGLGHERSKGFLWARRKGWLYDLDKEVKKTCYFGANQWRHFWLLSYCFIGAIKQNCLWYVLIHLTGFLGSECQFLCLNFMTN